MSKRHYVVITYKAGAKSDVTMGPAFGHCVRDTFYHWHGPTRMGWPPDAVIVKDYGMVDSEDDLALRELEVRFMRDFPIPHDSKAGGGWLAPDGKYYPCRSWEHSRNIVLLALQIYGTYSPGTEGYGTEDRMERLGWLKLYDDLVVVPRYKALTQAQIDTLGELLQIEDQDDELIRSIQDRIRRTDG